MQCYCCVLIQFKPQWLFLGCYLPIQLLFKLLSSICDDGFLDHFIMYQFKFKAWTMYWFKSQTRYNLSYRLRFVCLNIIANYNTNATKFNPYFGRNTSQYILVFKIQVLQKLCHAQYYTQNTSTDNYIVQWAEQRRYWIP